MNRNRSVFLLDLVFDFKKNALQNLLISLQIGLLLWASTLVAGFFLPYITSIEADEAGGYYLYSANSNTTEAYLDFDQWFNTMGDQAYIQNFEQLWNALHSDADFTFYLCQENVAYVTQFCMETAFEDTDFSGFLGKPTYDTAYRATVIGFLEAGSSVTVQDGKSTYVTVTESLDYAIVLPFTLFEGSYWYRISSPIPRRTAMAGALFQLYQKMTFPHGHGWHSKRRYRISLSRPTSPPPKWATLAIA